MEGNTIIQYLAQYGTFIIELVNNVLMKEGVL